MADTDTLPPDVPVVPPAPASAEDLSRRIPVSGAAPQTFPGYPKTKYHPVIGARTADTPNDEYAAFGGTFERNWFDTAAEADMHRTATEADQVVHNNRRVKVDAGLSPDKAPDEAVVRGEAGVVRNSVAATESLKSGFAEPL